MSDCGKPGFIMRYEKNEPYREKKKRKQNTGRPLHLMNALPEAQW